MAIKRRQLTGGWDDDDELGSVTPIRREVVTAAPKSEPEPKKPKPQQQAATTKPKRKRTKYQRNEQLASVLQRVLWRLSGGTKNYSKREMQILALAEIMQAHGMEAPRSMVTRYTTIADGKQTQVHSDLRAMGCKITPGTWKENDPKGVGRSARIDLSFDPPPSDFAQEILGAKRLVRRHLPTHNIYERWAQEHSFAAYAA